jgi:L-ribulokinase
MQIYADVLGRPVAISRSTQTCALGSAVAAAVVAGKEAGGFADFPAATTAMTGVQKKVFKPIPKNVAIYEKLYQLYKQTHDAFGVKTASGNLYNVMKDLLEIRDAR